MERIILLLFLCTTIESLVVRKQHFINMDMNWYAAQTYCRQHYTDLSFVEKQRDPKDFKIAAGGVYVQGWIGLNRDDGNETGWRWSGGAYAIFTDWEDGQPNGGNQIVGGLRGYGKWFDYTPSNSFPFYCVHLTMEKEVKKSWEEALEHCRDNDSDLIGRPYQTMFLHTQQLMREVSTDHVWVGLRYLDDHWLWLSGDPVEKQVWPTGADQDHPCPVWNRCGALSKEGLWEAHDCQEKLNFICY